MNVKVDTKERILEVANHLFASHGFHGTSIRDIAAEADINLASVNYHFKNKLNLYHELFRKNYMWMQEQIDIIARDDSLCFSDLTLKVYDFFYENSDHLINGFKIMLTQDIKCEEMDKSKVLLGPPGQESFLKVITRELPKDVSLESKLWLVRTVFTSIVHNAMVNNSHLCQNMIDSTPFMRGDFIKLSIESHTQALIDFVLKHPKKFLI